MLKSTPEDRFLRDLGGLYQVCRMYPGGNDQIGHTAERAFVTLGEAGGAVWFARVGHHLVVGDRTVTDPPSGVKAVLDALGVLGWESVEIASGVSAESLTAWVQTLVRGEGFSVESPGIQVGRLSLDSAGGGAKQADRAAGDLAGLLPGVRDVLERLLRGDRGGLGRAQEVVAAVAGLLASGEGFLRPIQDLIEHDSYTYTHALNVSVLSTSLARALGASRQVADAIGLAALCHDVGKQRIPKEILNKAGALTDEERRLINNHPLEGVKMLLETGNDLHPLLPVVTYQHHRCPDGSGYPVDDGPIHPASLVVAVCDVYDALRTTRPYRGGVETTASAHVLIHEAARGRLHPGYVETLVGLLGVVGPDSILTLSDGSRVCVLEPGPTALRPVVCADDGREIRLADEPDLRVTGLAWSQADRPGS